MARKINPHAKPAAAPKPDPGAEDLSILHPDVEIEIGGRKLTVREYGFMEGLRLQRAAAPILDALVKAAEQPGEDGFQQILDVLADHPDALTALVAQAADVDAAFVAGLTDAEGQSLLMTWWLVNGGFFVRRVVRRLAIAHAAKAQASAGAISTPASSTTDTIANGSATTPSVN